jgi:integrase/recombinase XerD
VSTRFHGPVAGDLERFLQFKWRLGYRYARAESRLREFDRFLQAYVVHRRAWRLDQAMLAWLASKPQRKAISVGMDATVLRQLCCYLRRRPGRAPLPEPLWPRLRTEVPFVPYILTGREVRRLLDLAAVLDRPRFRAPLYRALLLLLYCTGLRFGEALRLRLQDVDTRVGVLFVEPFKGRARWVPFHRSLAREFDQYLTARRAFAPAHPEARFFVGANCQTLPAPTAGRTVRCLLQAAGLKPAHGRVGPRPYDLRHAFAVERLTRWYRQGVDLHARLPWLSAYMGHADIVGTETYLHATPTLWGLASERFRQRYLRAPGARTAP